MGRYIVDFVCFESQLVVEVDGGMHTESSDDDAVRTAWLNSIGFDVIRFRNCTVLSQEERVVDRIAHLLNRRRG